MKLDALDHPKTLDFAARLGVELPTAIGHLELLWAFTGKKAPQGNIGKWADGAIARACYWMGRPEVFIQALTDAGFIDADSMHRLTIHDWHEHAPRWVKLKLTKVGLPFISGSLPSTDESIDDSIEASIEASIEPATEASSKGSEGKGSEERGRKSALTRGPPTRSKGKKPKTALPAEFELDDELRAYAEQHLPQVDAGKLFESFCGKARAKSWVYADWRQAWQGFCRDAAPNSGHWSAGQYPKLAPKAEPAMMFAGQPVRWA